MFNGEILPEDHVALSPVNRGVMYGDGCFDTLRSYKGKFLLLQSHFEVFSFGLEYLGIKTPFPADEFRSLITSLLKSNDRLDKEVIVRTQCWRKGGRGYRTHEEECDWMITLLELPERVDQYSLATVRERTIPNESLNRNFKLSNGLNFIIAARQARQQGADDALMLTTKGEVSETTIANLFWIKDGVIFTPSEKCDLYPGITRELMKMVISISGYTLKEGEFTPEHLSEAEAVFATNSVREIIPVSRIDNSDLKTDHPVLTDLIHKFAEFKLIQLQ